MRIYILSNSLLKKNSLAKLEPYFQGVRHISYIWSIQGLLQVENNKIYQVRIHDVLARKSLLGAYPITIDESEFIREEECFQIAPRAYKEYTTLKSYRLTPSSEVEWVVEYKDDELHDNYFQLPKTVDIHTPKIKAELLEFLNL